MERVTVRDAMNLQAAAVSADVAMSKVIEIMAATDTAGVTVVRGDGTIAGYVTDGDVARYLASHDQGVVNPSSGIYALFLDDGDFRERMRALADVNVMELATKRVVSVEDGMPLEKACSILSERRIKKMPVTHDGVLVGALSRRNIMHFMMDELGSEQA